MQPLMLNKNSMLYPQCMHKDRAEVSYQSYDDSTIIGSLAGSMILWLCP